MIRRFARLGSENIVTTIIVADSIEWCEQVLGGLWVETFKDNPTRYSHAGIGFTYDADRDAFIPPQPYASWVLDEATCQWVAPIAYPAEGDHVWDEQAGDWVEVEDEAP